MIPETAHAISQVLRWLLGKIGYLLVTNFTSLLVHLGTLWCAFRVRLNYSRLTNISLFKRITLEAEVGIEPTNDGFANHCLTTWRLRRYRRGKRLITWERVACQCPDWQKMLHKPFFD